MKKCLFILLLTVSAQSFIYAQLRIPATSPTQTIKQDFGISSMELTYSRPNKRGRTVMGDLVPFGNVWRTGANQATTITFGDEVVMGGKSIPAGKYGLLTIPGKETWILIVTKQLDVTSPDAYKQENDVVRVSSKPVTMNSSIETFTILFGNVRANSCELQIMWEQTAVSFPIKYEVDQKVMALIEEEMKKDKPAYFTAASYYFDNDKDLKKANEWTVKAIQAEPEAFYMVHLLAKIQAKQGNKAGAVASAKKSIELSRQAKNSDYVRLNEKLIAGLQ